MIVEGVAYPILVLLVLFFAGVGAARLLLYLAGRL
jgi:hypothetical protein